MKNKHFLWSIAMFLTFLSCKSPYADATYDGLVPMKRIISNQFVKNAGGYKVYLNPDNGTVAFDGAEFETADFFSCGLAYIVDASKENRRMGFIDQHNNLVIDCSKLRFATGFSDNRAITLNFNQEYNIIDPSGNSILTLSAHEWTPLIAYKDGLSVWKYQNDWATIDTQGTIRHFTGTYPASDCYHAHNLLCVYDSGNIWNSRCGAINLKTGELQIPLVFDSGFTFDRNGYAVVRDEKTRRFGLIDTKGNYTMQPCYESIATDGPDLYKCKMESKWFWANHAGERIWHYTPHLEESIFFFCGRKQIIDFEYNKERNVFEFTIYTKESGRDIFKTTGGAYLVYPPAFRNGNGIANYYAGRNDHRCRLVDKDFNPIGDEEFHVSYSKHMWNQDDNMARLQLFYTHGIPYATGMKYR